MGLLKILGKVFNFKESDEISVVNNKILVNDKALDVDIPDKSKINITIDGSIKSIISTSGNIIVEGNVLGNINSCSGDVKVCGSVNGDIVVFDGKTSVENDD